MCPDRRINTWRTLACVALAGMWLIANQPLHVSDGRPHGCEGNQAAASPEIIQAPLQTGCQHAGVTCSAAAGCITVASALVPNRPTLLGFRTLARGCDVRLTAIVDLYGSGPPTPPPNS